MGKLAELMELSMSSMSLDSLGLSVYKRWNSGVWKEFEDGLKKKDANLDLLSEDFDESLEAVWEHLAERHADVASLRHTLATPLCLISDLPRFSRLTRLHIALRVDFDYAEAENLRRFSFPVLKDVSLDVASAQFMLHEEQQRFRFHLNNLVSSWVAVERVRLRGADWDAALELLEWQPCLPTLEGLILLAESLADAGHSVRLAKLLHQNRRLRSLVLSPTLCLDDAEAKEVLEHCENFSQSLRILGRPSALNHLSGLVAATFPRLARQEVWDAQDEARMIKAGEEKRHRKRYRRNSSLTNKKFFDEEGRPLARAYGSGVYKHQSSALSAGSVSSAVEEKLGEQRDAIEEARSKIAEEEWERQQVLKEEADEERRAAREEALQAQQEAIKERMQTAKRRAMASSGGGRRKRSIFGY